MEETVEILTTRPSLLNEYCLLHIFEYLELDDSINFANTCKYVRLVAERVFKKYSDFKLFWNMLEKGERYINCILSYIGPHISSLQISFFNLNLDLSKYLKIIDRNCSNLKCLKINDYQGKAEKKVLSGYNFKEVEMLTLFRFDSSSTKRFLQSFRHLKILYIVECTINMEETMKIFHNNPNIDTFYSYDLDCLKLLPLIPNVQKLCVGGGSDFELLPNVWTLLTLNCLTKLKLDCDYININSVLRELAKKGIMEEIDLKYVDIDDDFFDILASFENIQLLSIEYAQRNDENKRLKASIVWPSKLNSLRLSYFELTFNDFIEIIRQVTSLQRMDICMSDFAESDLINFEDSKKWLTETIPRILKVVDSSTGNQCREIQLDYIYSDTEEVIGDTSVSYHIGNFVTARLVILDF